MRWFDSNVGSTDVVGELKVRNPDPAVLGKTDVFQAYWFEQECMLLTTNGQ